MRTAAPILTVMAATISMRPAGPHEKAGPAVGSAKKVDELRRGRIATLREAFDLSVRVADARRPGYAEVLEARVRLLKAEPDAAEKGSDRAALHGVALESAKRYEAVLKAGVEACHGNPYDMLRVEAGRLGIGIASERARAGEAKGHK